MQKLSLTILMLLSLLVNVSYGQSSWYVSENGNDATGDGSSDLPWATITFAMDDNAVIDGDTIHIVGIITQDGGGEMGIQIQKDLVLTGESKETSILQAADYESYADGRVLTIWDVADVTLLNLTIRNGTFMPGSFQSGAGILNWGNLTIENCIITDNYCENEYLGGGIYNQFGTLRIHNTYIHSNFSALGGAGIVSEGGILSVENSSVALNFTQDNLALGAGILITGEAEASIINSTIYFNLMGLNSFGGGMHIMASDGDIEVEIINSTIADNEVGAGGLGNGIFIDNSTQFIVDVEIKNSIIANDVENNFGQNSTGPINLQRSYTLCRDATFPMGELDGNINSTNPQIESFMNHGGDTPTCSIAQTSPVINAGTASGAPESDQRGMPRSGDVDMGSYEYQLNTGILPQTKMLELKVYPNPANQFVIFNLPSNIQSS
ncbi:MAG: right-handed parallel beta-helix repeat-containing protein, partial [Bacteroidales bacterium]|nr:right-handed parallel beta-helix repeat-containing protein [Bacteroidales bacterium]